jgi:hypothetical protein
VTDAPPPNDEPRDAVLDALWERALAAWEDDKVHNALLDHALRAERLPDLAGRYRAVSEDPERGVRAKKRIDAIVLAATQSLMAMKTPKVEKPPIAITLSAFAICFILLGWLAWAIWGPR